MEEGTFVEWLKHEGDHVAPGEALFVLESDKSAENIEAIDAGILRLAPDSPRPGDRVKVGQVIAYLAAEGEKVALPEAEKGELQARRASEGTLNPSPPAPLPEAERGEQEARRASEGMAPLLSSTPSPLRGGGRGEGFFTPPLTQA
jgi:pyruvate/2-oxoglutarate dehydrogenase complex dihydrolipoamide acyltransferase (E2) component